MITDLSSQIRRGQVPSKILNPESEHELMSVTRCERIQTRVMETEQEGAAAAALEVVRCIDRNVAEKGRCVVAFGAGENAMPVYDELVKLYFADKVSFGNVVAFSLSEFGLGDVTSNGQGTINRLKERLFNKIDIPKENIHTFSDDASRDNVNMLCKAYETEIDDFGGLDLVVCELSKNGGLVFNEPGTSSVSTCRLVSLSSESRNRIAKLYQCEHAPNTAVTLGVSNIMAANSVVCVAFGDERSNTVVEAVEGRFSDQYPASFLQMHHNVTLFADIDASSRLTRVCCPWKVTSCDWTDAMTRRAIVWLSGKMHKSILKLTTKDYYDNGLSELVMVCGSAYNVNVKVFNDLQHTITGWPGGKPDADDSRRPERAVPYPKRVLVFSPHPDDVVVSMGGTLRRLVEQGHDVHVVAQTSGDVVVSDEDMLRSIRLLEKVMLRLGVENQRFKTSIGSMKEFAKSRKVIDPDLPNMRVLKGLIYSSELHTSLRSIGVAEDHVHELSMPFYSNDPKGRGNITEADVSVLKHLIMDIKPNQIFFADDLGDPYGTHYLATNALLAAIDELKNEECLSDCRIWMYRGQWGAWNIDDVEMAVPMSPEEFASKRDAVLKFQSQIHDAPFRDSPDVKLSWQRSLDQNKALAAQYCGLGLADYEAIEAFVQYCPA